MKIEEEIFVRTGLEEGGIVTCELRIGTVSIIRPVRDAYTTLRWGNGDSKTRVASITDKESFLDFLMTLAETHNLSVRLEQRSQDKIACKLVQRASSNARE